MNDNTLLLAAFDAASNGIIIIDHQQANDPIIYCNPAFEKLTGYNKGEVMGQNCRFLQGGERMQEGRFTVQEALANNSHCVVELRNFRKDGTEFWNEIHIAPISNEDGITTHFIGIQNDISDRKLNDMLQQKKDEFISAASHELKTPVTSLKASLQLLDKLNQDPETTKVTALITQANKSVNKVASLIDELLLSDQLAERKLALTKSQFSLGKLIGDCCSNIRLEGKYHILTSGDTDVIVYADFERMDQVLLNLISNAVDHAPGAPEIAVLLSKDSEWGKITVTDNGPGIAAEKLPLLFERFYTADPNHSTGFGVGLYICAQIVKSNGGNIGVESELGKGSSFWFTLPLA